MAVVNRPIDPPVRLVIADVHGTLVTQKKVLTARGDIRHASNEEEGFANAMERFVL